jgi:hypothetical protein
MIDVVVLDKIMPNGIDCHLLTERRGLHQRHSLDLQRSYGKNVASSQDLSSIQSIIIIMQSASQHDD